MDPRGAQAEKFRGAALRGLFLRKLSPGGDNVERYYESNPDLRDYFASLPVEVKELILESGVEISTLGELMEVAEHFRRPPE